MYFIAHSSQEKSWHCAGSIPHREAMTKKNGRPRKMGRSGWLRPFKFVFAGGTPVGDDGWEERRKYPPPPNS
jgi:hypothetical protein